jgi:hypothetical protein
LLNRDIVAIGGSAGAIDVLRAFTPDLPGAFAAAVLNVIRPRERSTPSEELPYGSGLSVILPDEAELAT